MCWALSETPEIKQFLAMKISAIMQQGCCVEFLKRGEEHNTTMFKENPSLVEFKTELERYYTQAVAKIDMHFDVVGLVTLTMLITPNKLMVPVVLPREVLSIQSAYDPQKGCTVYRALESQVRPFMVFDLPNFRSTGETVSVSNTFNFQFKPRGENTTTASGADGGQTIQFITAGTGLSPMETALVIPHPINAPGSNGQIKSPLAAILESYLRLQLGLRIHMQAESNIASPAVFSSRQETPASVQTRILASIPSASPVEPSKTAALDIHEAEKDSRYRKENAEWVLRQNARLDDAKTTNMTNILPVQYELAKHTELYLTDIMHNPIPLPPGSTVHHVTPGHNGSNIKFLVEQFENSVAGNLQIPVTFFRLYATNENAASAAFMMIRNSMMSRISILQDIITTIFKACYMKKVQSTVETMFFRKWLVDSGAKEIVDRSRCNDRTVEALLRLGKDLMQVSSGEISRLQTIHHKVTVEQEDIDFVNSVLSRFLTPIDKIPVDAHPDILRVSMDELYRQFILGATEANILPVLMEMDEDGLKPIKKQTQSIKKKVQHELDVAISIPCTYGIDADRAMKLYTVGAIDLPDLLRLVKSPLGLDASVEALPADAVKRLKSLPKKVFDAMVTSLASSSTQALGLKSKGSAGAKGQETSKASSSEDKKKEEPEKKKRDEEKESEGQKKEDKSEEKEKKKVAGAKRKAASSEEPKKRQKTK